MQLTESRSRVKSGSESPKLVSIGTTDRLSKSQRNSVESLTAAAERRAGRPDAEWWAGVDAVWHTRTAPDVERLRRRASSARRRAGAAMKANALNAAISEARSAKWAEWRARATSMGRRDAVDVCGTRQRSVSCACGPVVLPVGCGLGTLCARCSAREWSRWRRRIGGALSSHLAHAVASWGRAGGRGVRPGVFLLTLTAPHSGDLVADRRKLAAAWRAVSRAASAGKWWGAHVSVWEATPGSDGGGHVHLHVAAVSSWVPYAYLRSVWSRAIGAATHVHVSPPDAKSSAKAALGAAKYVAKYVSKGVQPSEMSAQKCGELLVAQRGRRKVTASRGFWGVRAPVLCRCCGEGHALVALPVSLATAAPVPCWRALVRGVVDTPRVQLT